MDTQQRLKCPDPTYPPDFPPPPIENMKTLIFDLDDTLVHTTTSPSNSNIDSFQFGNPPYYVLERPGLPQLLQKYSKLFDIFIFTSGERFYADPIINVIWPFLDEQHRLFRNSCTVENLEMRKDLTAFKRPEKEIILVEDNVFLKKFYPKNTIIVPRFSGSPKDNILTDWLPSILDNCASSNDVREIIGNIDDCNYY
ncbi:hypothetical protein M9Y10_039666 [Tritrichomonas musculus]|uniref:Mitochondrial import inner membrane translocase subunit TIM50 n=1 Tax=Tritrichomonas musculus TaxID=1915356 RepID=A0ABR2GRN7_9EUKA